MSHTQAESGAAGPWGTGAWDGVSSSFPVRAALGVHRPEKGRRGREVGSPRRPELCHVHSGVGLIPSPQGLGGRTPELRCSVGKTKSRW